MSNAEHLSGVDYFLTGTDLSLVNPEPVIRKADKVIYLFTDAQDHQFGAIIYLPTAQPGDRTFAVHQEITIRKELLTTPLAPYITHALRQSDDGLLIDWPGEMLTTLQEQYYSIDTWKYNAMKEILLTLYEHSSMLPNEDTLTLSNLIYDAQGTTGFKFLSVQRGIYRNQHIYRRAIVNLTREMKPLINNT